MEGEPHGGRVRGGQGGGGGGGGQGGEVELHRRLQLEGPCRAHRDHRLLGGAHRQEEDHQGQIRGDQLLITKVSEAKAFVEQFVSWAV
eukprot:6375422-Heterocapsa_arctica.AAC.1